jgi:hypothetical protein
MEEFQATPRLPQVSSITPYTTGNTHYERIVEALPHAIKDAPPARLSILANRSIASPPDWYASASDIDRNYLKELIDKRWLLQRLVDAPLKDLQQDIKAFAKPLLSVLMSSNFNNHHDVEDLSLRLYIPDRIIFGIDRGASHVRESTLLDAALHNFEEPETAADYFRSGSGVYSKNFRGELTLQKSYTLQKFTSLCRRLNLGELYQRHIKAQLLPDDPQKLNTLERNGAASEQAGFELASLMALLQGHIGEDAYVALRHVRENRGAVTYHHQPLHRHRLSLMGLPMHGIVLFSGESDPGKIKDAVQALTPEALTEWADWSQRLPALKGDIVDQFKLLKTFFANGPSGVSEAMLRREDIYQQSRLSGPLIAYIADDPLHPLKEYESLADFMKELISRLREPGYQEFFSRFVAQKDKGLFFARVRERLSRITWQQREPLDMGPWWRETAVENPHAEPITNRLPVDGLWLQLYRLKRDKTISDARAIAVPTGDEDATTRWKRLSSYLDIGWNLFNFGAMLVPGLGEVMLGVMVAQMAEELLEGLEDWSKGDRDIAGAHINGALINFAQLALMGTGHVLPAGVRAPLTPSPLIDSLKPVELPNGKTRLWKPDLAPYEHPVSLPVEAKPDELGLYQHNDEQWLRLEDKQYQVRQDPVTGRHRLQHPTRRNAYQPTVEHNNVGAWKAETEEPLTWDRSTLLRRLGYRADGFSDAELEIIRKISGTDEGLLRKMHVESEPVPPLLADTLNRFNAFRQTEEVIDNINQLPAEPRVELIKRRFTGVPNAVVEDLLAGATSAERRQMAQWDFANAHQTKPIPLRLAEALRDAQREVRLSRAYEGLYLNAALTVDTETLALHSLQKLPGRTQNLRIEIREGSIEGELRTSVGPENAAERKVLVRNEQGQYQARDSDNSPLHGADDVYGALLHALSQDQRVALGISDMTQGAQLKELVWQHALSRIQLRQALRMQPIKPSFKAPVRGGNGSLGYPMSGRGPGVDPQVARNRARVTQLYPTYNTAAKVDEYLQMVRSLSSGMTVDRFLQHMELEFDSLKNELDAWVQTPATYTLADGSIEAVSQQDRQQVAHVLRSCWQRTELPEIAGETRFAGRTVKLSGLHIGELPAFDRAAFAHIDSLDLSAMGLREVPASFLDSFPNLRELHLPDNRLQTLPASLPQLTRLAALDLSRNAISLTREAVAELEKCKALLQLHMSHNPLGRSPDFRLMPQLRQIALRNTHLGEWPAGLDGLEHIEGIDLRDNLITRLPDDILNPTDENATAARRVFMKTLVEGNPLPNAAMEDYAQAWMRFSCAADAPPVPIAPAPAATAASADEQFERWVRNLSADQRVIRQEQWEQLKGIGPQAGEFFDLLERMRNTAEFRLAYPDLQARVLALLDAAEHSQPLRTELFQLAGDIRTCTDGDALIFNQLEVRNLADSGLNRQATLELSTLAKGLFRLDEVERFAQQDASARIDWIMRQPEYGFEEKIQEIASIDRVEIRLAYRIGLRDRLGLPGQPQLASYLDAAHVTQAMLDAAEQHVLTLDNSAQEFMSTTQRDFWRAHLKSKYAEELLKEQESIHARQEALDATPNLTSQEYKTRSDEMKHEFKLIEDAFIQRKTKLEIPEFDTQAS